jgi:hypothetical protein
MNRRVWRQILKMDHIWAEVYSKWASERLFLWKKAKYKK